VKSKESISEPGNVLNRIKRGLSGYVSYLAACEMNQAFSEYVLYEPILRILTARGYTVNCEFPCPGLPKPVGGGDCKKIDFEVNGHGQRFAMEVKWAKRTRLDVGQDHLKLDAFHNAAPASRSFLCAFGRKSHIENLSLVNGTFTEFGVGVYADFRITKYGCRIYEISFG
jgi:hypothetical protein